MMPLWMTVTSPVQSTWGWALRSFGRPCVAQRVWARPMAAEGVTSSSAVRRFEQLAGALLHEEVAVGGDEGDARRVIAAVFEALQALEQDGAASRGPM